MSARRDLLAIFGAALRAADGRWCVRDALRRDFSTSGTPLAGGPGVESAGGGGRGSRRPPRRKHRKEHLEPRPSRTIAARAGRRWIELPGDGPITVLAAGKAAAAMARGALDVLGDRVVGGVVVVPDGVDAEFPGLEVLRGGHPVPDDRSLLAGERLLEVARGLPAGTRVLGLWSGGGSALAEALAEGRTLEGLAAETSAWLRDGLPIGEINQRRRVWSRLKGGGLARESAARFHNLVLSDVEGDDPAVVASGPGVLPGDGSRVIGDLATALAAAKAEAFALRYAPLVLDARVRGEVREVGARLLGVLRALPEGGPPMALLLAGEPTVTVRGAGAGGRMQALALQLALGMEGVGATVLCVGTDGRDGPTDAAGAIVDGGTAARIRAAGLDPAARAADDDSHRALAAAGDLVRTGPTSTNVGDLVVVVRPA